ncbi:M23 family metallopeptidase [Tersicoccus sp. MR15.9]
MAASPAAAPAFAGDRLPAVAGGGTMRTGTTGVPRASPTPAPRGWQWPLQPRPAVLRPFDAPEQQWSAGHRGVDLAGGPGSAVRSPAAGTVVFVGVVVDRPVLAIAHADGLRTSVEPVTATVHRGDRVAAGQVVGQLAGGRSHCSPATCLHWGVRLGEDYVDPLSLILDRRPSILLPLSPSGGLP